MVRTIFLNGTIGTGKTATIHAISNHLAIAPLPTPHALVDMKQITTLHPTPFNDRFGEEVALANLKSIAANYAAAGAKLFFIAGVIENEEKVAAYAEAVGEGLEGFTVVRLKSSPQEAERRLLERYGGEFGDKEELEWHLHNRAELDGILDAAKLGITVVSDGKRPEQVAKEVLEAVGIDGKG